MLFSTPEYAGALPGSFKNLLDWTVGGGETYGMPVGWVNIAGMAAPSGGSLAHDSLRTVLTYTGAEIVEAACVRIPVGRSAVGADGTIADAEIRAGLTAVLTALADAAGSSPRWTEPQASTISVTGPSLISATPMQAPKTPFLAPRRSQKRS